MTSSSASSALRAEIRELPRPGTQVPGNHRAPSGRGCNACRRTVLGISPGAREKMWLTASPRGRVACRARPCRTRHWRSHQSPANSAWVGIVASKRYVAKRGNPPEVLRDPGASKRRTLHGMRREALSRIPLISRVKSTPHSRLCLKTVNFADNSPGRHGGRQA